MHQKLIQNFLQAGAYGNDIGKEPQKPRPKLKNMYFIFTENICSTCNPMQVIVFQTY